MEIDIKKDLEYIIELIDNFISTLTVEKIKFQKVLTSLEVRQVKRPSNWNYKIKMNDRYVTLMDMYVEGSETLKNLFKLTDSDEIKQQIIQFGKEMKGIKENG